MIDEHSPGLNLSLDPLDDYVVIQPSDEETETRAGLIIPASAENSCRSGVVKSAGKAGYDFSRCDRGVRATAPVARVPRLLLGAGRAGRRCGQCSGWECQG